MDAMSCLPPPASFLSSAYYTDDVIARALHYSMSHHYSFSSPAASSSNSPSSSSSQLLADLPFNWTAPATGLTCDSVLVASDAAPRPSSTAPVTSAAANNRRLGLGPAGRAAKRRPRASKRAPTTYITTDPSNFRLMVQHVTGVQAQPAGDDDGAVLQVPASSFGDAQLRMPASSGGDAGPELHPSLQQQQPCYPTLDSWSVMYESAEELL